jgi:serine/threonine protein kinase
MTTVISSVDHLIEVVRKSGLMDEQSLEAKLQEWTATTALPEKPSEFAKLLVRDGLVTVFQANQLLQGKHRGFVINGRYKVLEMLGSGGMGTVFLCEHVLLSRLVALKVLPFDQLNQPSAVERFYREARALAALDHPNIVRAYDMDRDRKLHFLVMEYVDGADLQNIVAAHGPLDPERATHYVTQAAAGLQHAHDGGWVHRDIKPGNILVDRNGTVKILDLGLARLFQDNKDMLTRQFDEKSILGTADYLSPEQGIDSHAVDIRSDIYSLGATFYFLLTGQPPFAGGSLSKKLIHHQMHDPRPIREIRAEIPEELAAVVTKMMAKDPMDRYQIPDQVAEALTPWTQQPLTPLELPGPEQCAAVRSRIQSYSRSGPSSGPRQPPNTPTPRPPTKPLASKPATSTPRSSPVTGKRRREQRSLHRRSRSASRHQRSSSKRPRVLIDNPRCAVNGRRSSLSRKGFGSFGYVRLASGSAGSPRGCCPPPRSAPSWQCWYLADPSQKIEPAPVMAKGSAFLRSPIRRFKHLSRQADWSPLLTPSNSSTSNVPWKWKSRGSGIAMTEP